MGLCPKPCLGDFFRRSPLRTFKTFNSIGFMSLFLRCTDSGVAVFRATISGCSRAQSHPAGLGQLTLRSRYRIVLVGCLLMDGGGGGMRGAPFGLRPYRVRNLSKVRDCRERPVCRSVSVESRPFSVSFFIIPYFQEIVKKKLAFRRRL